MEFPVEDYNFNPTTLEDVKQVLEQELKEYFQNVTVNVKDCPNLLEKPYELANEGFGGEMTGIMDIGGPPFLIPLPDKSKVYDLKSIIPQYAGTEGYPNGWYVSGAGAGPFPSQGSNCEMVVNMMLNSEGQMTKNKSKVALTSNGTTKDCELRNLGLDESRCALLSNLMVSGGSGKVLEIECEGRKANDENFTSSIRKSLASGFEYPIGLAGIFLVDKSKTKIHIMRDFSSVPLESDDDVNKWLKFIQMDPPMLFQSVLVSRDPGLDLRIDHSHGWSLNKEEGGHYHYDIFPENVIYKGYFAIAQKLWRIDKPSSTHHIGRD